MARQAHHAIPEGGFIRPNRGGINPLFLSLTQLLKRTHGMALSDSLCATDALAYEYWQEHLRHFLHREGVASERSRWVAIHLRPVERVSKCQRFGGS